MDAVNSPSVEEHNDVGDALRAARRLSNPNRRKSQPKSRAVLASYGYRTSERASFDLPSKGRLFAKVRPQKVIEINRFADVDAESPSATRPRGIEQNPAPNRAQTRLQQSQQRPQAVPTVVKTKSRQVLRRPERWVPAIS
ncbi:hypothetical protein LTR66_000595 [Elasticomyces elasticus]|nr:hypothetical protein LTR66_000595 [Elasticomyces elasticus]